MKAIYIPAGPKNLQVLFPSLKFRDIENYYLELVDQTGDPVATSTKYTLEICDVDTARVHFLNPLGAIDAINFHIVEKETENKSDTWQKPLGLDFNREQHGTSRFNVRSNDLYTVKTADYSEDEMEWVAELLRAPMAWLELKGTQGDADSYLPIVILDDKIQKIKEEDRYTYEVTLKFRLSHETINIRN